MPSSSSRPPPQQPSRSTSWSQGPTQNPSPLGKWATSRSDDSRPTSFNSRSDRLLQRAGPSSVPPATGTSPIGRWGARLDSAPHQRSQPGPSSSSPHPQSSNQSSRYQREAAPHIGSAASSALNGRPRSIDPRERSRSVPPGLNNHRQDWGDRNRDRGTPTDSKPDVKTKLQQQDIDDGSASRDTDATPATTIATDDSDFKGNRKFGKVKDNFKTRGSIASRFRGNETSQPVYVKTGGDKPQMSLRAAQEKEKERKRKSRAFRKVNPDVFIPSTVSVGQLARLLNVRMGSYSFPLIWSSF